MKYKITDIEWEVDNVEDLETLPTECEIECEDDDDIVDTLSDKYGFLIKNLYYDEIYEYE